MRKDTPDKARRLLQELANQRMKLKHPVMGGHDYYASLGKIMEHNDSQVLMLLSNALSEFEKGQDDE